MQKIVITDKNCPDLHEDIQDLNALFTQAMGKDVSVPPSFVLLKIDEVYDKIRTGILDITIMEKDLKISYTKIFSCPLPEKEIFLHISPNKLAIYF